MGGGGTLSVDLILQQLLHCLLFSYVQGCFTFTVHASNIGALADQIPATKTTNVVSVIQEIFVMFLSCRVSQFDKGSSNTA